MNCPACGHENPDSSRFCGECASPLAAAAPCGRCGAANPHGQKFCNSCGSPLSEPVAGAPEPTPVPEHLVEKIRAGQGSIEGERKQVTVLFGDVKGSMELAEAVDPEPWRRIMQRFFAILSAGIHRFEGTVDKFTGDGIMALFGAPIAHEDHGARACYAALHLQRELAGYAAELRREQGLNFSVRIGLNSGEVVVGAIGDDLSLDYTAIGHTVGLAQRMEALAEPGKTYLTENTARLVSGYFSLRDLGDFELKGARQPIRVHELEGVGPMRTRLDLAGTRGFSRFVGRRDELASVEGALAHAIEGNGQVVGVVGEPGVGKSRLCYEFAERCRAEAVPVTQGHGVAHGKQVPLLPILEILRDWFGVSELDSDQTAREKIAGKLLLLDEEFRAVLPLVFDFLGVPDPERPPSRMDPEARQRQLLAIGKQLVQARSRKEPGVILFEDLHWFDETSEVFLENLVDSVAGTRTLLLLNFRPEYHAGWMRKSYYQQLPLLPLGPAAIRELLDDLLGSDPSLAGLGDRIQDRTGGNPFFVEEVVQTLAEAGALEGDRGSFRLVQPIEDVTIPPSVQAVLAARIDRLGEREKRVLQAAAVIGKDFAGRVLERIAGLGEEQIEAAVRSLIAAEFLFEQEVFPEVEYAFKHPLTQEVAYGSQLEEHRAEVHTAVARVIADLYPDKLDERAALLAHHWERAGDPLEAARWSSRAALWAGQSHPAEAVRHWRTVRDLLRTVDDTPERTGLGIAACIGIFRTGGWRYGMSEEEMAQVFAEGRELAERSGEPLAMAGLLGGYGVARGMSGEVLEALELTEEGRRLAEQANDLEMSATGAGYWHQLAGRLGEALEMSERTIERTRHDPSLGRLSYGFSAYVWTVMFRAANLLTSTGRLREAERELERGIALAREHDEIETLGWAQGSYALLASFTGDPEPAAAHVRQSMEIAEHLGSTFSRVLEYANLGNVRRLMGEWDAAAEAFERAIEIGRGARTGLQYEPGWLAGLAEAELGRGNLARAQELCLEAVDLARRRGTRELECRAWLSLARVLLRDDGASDAGAAADALGRARELMEETGAVAFEPQIRVELAQLHRMQGDEEGAERELHEAYRRFEEMGASGYAAQVAEQLAAVG